MWKTTFKKKSNLVRYTHKSKDLYSSSFAMLVQERFAKAPRHFWQKVSWFSSASLATKRCCRRQHVSAHGKLFHDSSFRKIKISNELTWKVKPKIKKSSSAREICFLLSQISLDLPYGFWNLLCQKTISERWSWKILQDESDHSRLTKGRKSWEAFLKADHARLYVVATALCCKQRRPLLKYRVGKLHFFEKIIRLEKLVWNVTL